MVVTPWKNLLVSSQPLDEDFHTRLFTKHTRHLLYINIPVYRNIYI